MRVTSGLLLLGLVVGSFGTARADVLFDNSTQSVSGDATVGAPTGPLFASFSTPGQSEAFSSLTSVTLLLNAQTPGDGGSIDVALLSDSGGTPGAPLASLGSANDSSLNNFNQMPSSILFTPSAQILLAPGSQYWIEVSDAFTGSNCTLASTSCTSAVWLLDSGDNTPTTQNEFTATSQSLGMGLSPTMNSVSGGFLMTVTAQSVPEPSSALTLVVGLLGLAFYRRRQRHA